MSNQSDFSGTVTDSETHDEVETLASGDAGATPSTKQTTSTPWYLSRTLWINVAALLSLLVPAVRDWLTANPVEFTSVLGAINVLLRFVTVGKYQLAEPTGDQDGGVDESAPRASHTSGAGGSAIMLMIGMSLIMMTWACSSTDKQAATSVSLTDGQVVVIRGGYSLVLDRDSHSVAWSQSTPDVVVVPPVVQATSK
ncbi:MAG: hypothetical protein KHX31_12240 [Akkermansia sp.]|uniref:hypothetical protein n=1 Tax=Akkermansia sp. TaxID=1872421 RepID=UPI0025B81640|nr:hypothetical protein [Akkermansia sp.]MBS5509392.1 hypothetical protein [Akkermansia sp.]